MKIEGYEEISHEEFYKLPNEEGLRVEDWETDKIHYFKKVQKFPIVFSFNEKEELRVDDLGRLYYEDYDGRITFFSCSKIPILLKAVEKAKEVMKKNDKN